MIRSRTALPLAVLLTAASALAAQSTCPGCEWADRGDRSEGVRTKSLMISGGSFELLSVAYRAARGPSGAEHRLRLAFWVPEPAGVDEVRVWTPLPSPSDREKLSYVMKPRGAGAEAGLATFSWSQGDVVAPLGLPLESLHVLIRSGEVHLPGLLSAAPAPQPSGYDFVFESSAGIDADCDIVGPDGATVRSMECYEEYGGTITVAWDGLDEDGEPVAHGEYRLRIEGDMLAETIRPLEANIRFQHRSSLE